MNRWHGSRRDVLTGSARIAMGGLLGVALTRLGYAEAAGTPISSAYPELVATVTDDAIVLSATEIPAGYVLLTVVNHATDASSAGIIGPGPGKTMQDLIAEANAATPEAANAFPPPFFYTATLPGGPSSIAPGATGQAVVQLAAGDWAVWGGSESTNPQPVFFTATAGSSGQSAPDAAVAITLVDFAFGGFGQAISAGQQTWAVTNQGTQPHMLSLSQVPDGTTLAQVLDAVGRPDTATPPAGGLVRSDFADKGGGVPQSPGTTVWPVLDLPAGHYVALCFVGDPNHDGMPHAMEGMVALFDVR